MPEQPNISPTERQLLLRLDALLDELVAAGFPRDRVGTPMRLRLLDLLNQLPPETLPEQLKFKVSALVCHSEAEQVKFYEIFDAFVGRFLLESQEKAITPTEEKPEPTEPKIPETTKTESPKPVQKEAPKGRHSSDTVKAARSGPITVELHFRDDGYRPWNLPELEAAVRPLREKELSGAEEWDIPATIKKTIAAGGAPHFARRRRKKAPQYLFLIEQKSARDHLAAFYADLAVELQRRDLDVEYYFYDRIPQKCWKVRRDPASYTSINRLNASFAHSRLILIGEPDGLLAVSRTPGNKPDQVNTKIHRYPSALAFALRDNWTAVAMLNTRSTALWGDAEQAIYQLFPVAPANVAGLGSLMGQWKSHLSFRPYYWQTECPEPIPPGFQDYDGTAETIETHIKSLKIYLGRQGYTWLCAIAVYPEIYWQLTKILHDEAISAADEPDESLRTQLWHLHLLRMSRLAWLRNGYIPADYRQELRQGLPATNAADVRRQLLEVLQLDENKPPEGSYAEKDRAYTVALFDHERFTLLEKPDKERLAAMQEKLRQEVLDAGVAISDIEDAVGRSLFRNLPELPAESIKHFWVLWVDDSPNNNKDFQEKTSRERPIRFVNVTSTTQALETLQKQDFDLVISDVSRFGDKEAGMKMMPRFKAAGISLPVIFFTHPNYVSQHLEKLRDLGAEAVVSGFGQLEPLLLEAMRWKEEEHKESLAEIEFMDRLREVSRAVCRVVLEDDYGGASCSGFIVEGNYLLTVSHVFRNPENIQNARVEFYLQQNETGVQEPVVKYLLDPNDFIFSPIRELDFFKVKIIDRDDQPLSQWGVIELETSEIPKENEIVFLPFYGYQDQGNNLKIEQSETFNTEGNLLYIFKDARHNLPGAGGTPVLNQHFKAVGVFRAWVDKTASEIKQLMWVAVLIRDISANIQSQQTSGAEPVFETPNFAQSSSNVGPQPNQSSAVDPDADRLLQARAFLDNGIEARKKKEMEAAQSMLQNALELYSTANDDAGRANSQHELGKLFLETNRDEEALQAFSLALALYSKLDFVAAQAFVLMDIGKVELLKNNYDQAEKNYNEALEALEELSGDTSEDMLEVYMILAGIAQTKSEFEKANNLLLTALKLVQEADLKPQLLVVYTQLGNLKMDMNDSAKAVEYYTDALKFAQTEVAAGKIYELIAEAETQRGTYANAISALNKAQEIFLRAGDKETASKVAGQLQALNERITPKAPPPPFEQKAPESPVFESDYTPGTMKLFILSSQEDERISQTLNKHLAILRINKQISVFNNVSDIIAGEDWSSRIDSELKNADYVLPIVSVNLLASEYSFGLLQEALKSGKRVVPILAKKVDIEGTGLDKLKSLPSQGRWITDFKGEDEAYSDIVQEIKRLLPSGQSQTGESIVVPDPVKPKTNITAQQVRDLISKARLGDALKLLREAMPDNSEVLLLQGRLSELERDERLGVIDRRDANITRNQITAATLELTRDLPGPTVA